MKRTDPELLDAVRRGESKAMDELLGEYEAQIYRYGLRMCGNVEDAREVLQETLLAAFRNVAGFRGDAKLSTWLYQIARSFCIKLRRPGRDVLADVDLDDAGAAHIASPGATPDAAAHTRQIGEALAAAIAALPDTFREALVLRDVEGLSAEEAATIAGVEVAAHKSRLHRARLEVRRSLAALLDEPVENSPSPCPELAQELRGYIDSEVDRATCARIEEHLARCPSCARACDALKRSLSLCRQIPGGEVPAAVRLAVRHALRRAVGG